MSEDTDTDEQREDPAPVTGGRSVIHPGIRGDGDGNETTVTVLANELARDGLVLRADGLRTEDFEKNPVVLWDHGMDPRRGSEPIATATSIRKEEGEVIATVQWEADEFAQRIREKVKGGSIRAVSVGWNPVETIREEVDGERRTVIAESDMTEFSFVGVGADPDALVQERSMRALAEKIDELPGRIAGAVAEATVQESLQQTAEEGPEAISPQPDKTNRLTRKQKLARLIALLPRLRNRVRRKLGKA